MNTREEYTTEYLRNVRQANNESAKKELLKTLLVRLFDKDPKARKTIDRYLFRTERQTPTLELIQQRKALVAADLIRQGVRDRTHHLF